MNSKPDGDKVVQGPWTWNLLGRALAPAQRAGRYLPPDTACLVIASRYSEDYEPCSRHRYLRPEDRPVLQLNLPYPDMPTLGQIARKQAGHPWEPRNYMPQNLPPAIFRYLYGWKNSDFNHIDPERLMQDPDWYENLDPE